MKQFVLKDINPEKVTDFGTFLKEMNDMVVLITTASGPFVNPKNMVHTDDSDTFELNATENNYTVEFAGDKKDNKVTAGVFLLKEGKTKLLEASYTIGDIHPISIRVVLNCEGENLVEEEFYTAFERDFSHEAHQYMTTPLSEINAINQPSEAEVEDLAMEEVADEINQLENEIDTNTEEEEIENTQESTEQEEIIEELNQLSDKVLHSIQEVREIIVSLSQTCYDLTRGATLDFREEELIKQTLPNGAVIEMIDIDENGYKITFRKGSADSISEISFFLEKEGQLIFSLYLSSNGNGKISTGGDQSTIVLKKVKDNLL